MSVEFIHVDTCLPDYVLDHCNGDNEMLCGVPVDGRTRNGELRAELKREARAYGDKLPDSIGESEVNAAIDECFSGADGRRSFDSARAEFRQIVDAIASNDSRSGWRICAMEINYEDSDLVCDHSGKVIPAAYDSDEESES